MKNGVLVFIALIFLAATAYLTFPGLPQFSDSPMSLADTRSSTWVLDKIVAHYKAFDSLPQTSEVWLNEILEGNRTPYGSSPFPRPFSDPQDLPPNVVELLPTQTFALRQPGLRFSAAAENRIILAHTGAFGGSEAFFLTECGYFYRVSRYDQERPISSLIGKPASALAPYADTITEAVECAKYLDVPVSKRDLYPFKHLKPHADNPFHIEGFYNALAVFRNEYDKYPFDSRGGDFALYQLKEIVRKLSSQEGKPVTDDDFLGTNWGFDSATLSVFDRLTPIDYLNPSPSGTYEKVPDDAVILAEAPPGDESRKAWALHGPVCVIDLQGRLTMLDPRSDALQSMKTLVGHSVEELIALSTPLDTPDSKPRIP